MVISSNMNRVRAELTRALTGFGYTSRQVRSDWPLPSSRRLQDTCRPQDTIDLLVFADPARCDWQTSLIAADLSCTSPTTQERRDRALYIFQSVATPLVIVGDAESGRADIWFSCHCPQALTPEHDVSLDGDSIARVFDAHRPEVQLESLSLLRSGQRHLFDRYLYARRNDLAEYLQRGMAQAVQALQQRQPRGVTKESLAAFSRVGLGLLAARILEDKGALKPGTMPHSHPRELLGAAGREWDSFFDEVVGKDYGTLRHHVGDDAFEEAMNIVFAHLTGPVHFGLVTHEMLGDLYECILAVQTRSGDHQVKSKGAHYTPSTIASRILDRIPLDSMPTLERRVCDFACGSGSFLLAATDALARIYDAREDDQQRTLTAYLSDSVCGNDIDQVSVLISRLSFLLAYCPSGDAIPRPVFTTDDAISKDFALCFEGRGPTIMVGNPPFDSVVSPEKFLLKAVGTLAKQKSPWPRYLGMVMPQAFLSASEYRAARSELVRDARLMEVWELPDGAIGLYADVPTCVLVAEVGGSRSSRHPIRVCQTYSRRSDAIAAIRDQATPTWSYVVDPQRAVGPDSAQTLAFSPIDGTWMELSKNGLRVGDVASSAWGFVHTKCKNEPSPVFSSTRARGFVPFLRHQQALLPYDLRREDWRSSHGLDGKAYWKLGSGWAPRKGNWPKFRGPKIVVSSQTNRNARSQLIAAVDTHGIFPGKHFVVLSLTSEWLRKLCAFYELDRRRIDEVKALRWLCGILNSTIGHAWVARNASPRGSRGNVLTDMPLPMHFRPEVPTMVGRLGRLPRPSDIRQVGTWGVDEIAGEEELDASTKKYWELVKAVDDAVMGSYGLSDASCKTIRDFLSGFIDPQSTSRAIRPLPDSLLRTVACKTISVDVTDQTMQVEFSWRSLGKGVLQKIPIPDLMPGWALSVPCEFTCLAPPNCSVDDVRSDRSLLRGFQPMPHSYLDQAGLERLLHFEREDAPRT